MFGRRPKPVAQPVQAVDALADSTAALIAATNALLAGGRK